MTTTYLAGHLGTLVKPVGDVGGSIDQGVVHRVAGSADHQRVVHFRVVFTLALWGTAVLGVLRRLVARRLAELVARFRLADPQHRPASLPAGPTGSFAEVPLLQGAE